MRRALWPGSGTAQHDSLEQADVSGLKTKLDVQRLSPAVVAEDVQCYARKTQASNRFLEGAERPYRVALALALRADADIEYIGT